MARPQPPEEGPNVVRRFVLPALFVVALFAALWIRRPDTTPAQGELWTFTGPIMGTSFTVKVVASDKPAEGDKDKVEGAILAALKDVNQKMSTYQADSELSLFNKSTATTPVSISEDLHMVIAEAQRVSAASEGAFDITVGPLVNAWGFGPTDMGTPPTEQELEVLRPTIGHQRLTLGDDGTGATLSKEHAKMYVDLSAIAKGFGVDQIARVLDSLGHEGYMIEVGGEVRARGTKPDGEIWRIGIEKPDASLNAVQEVITLRDLSMATSGNYRNFYEKDGKRLSHTIDPRTGQPVEHRLASVTVFHEDCMSADAWATALNVLGEDKGFELAKAQELKALLLVKQRDGTFTELVTPAFEAMRKGTSDTP